MKLLIVFAGLVCMALAQPPWMQSKGKGPMGKGKGQRYKECQAPVSTTSGSTSQQRGPPDPTKGLCMGMFHAVLMSQVQLGSTGSTSTNNGPPSLPEGAEREACNKLPQIIQSVQSSINLLQITVNPTGGMCCEVDCLCKNATSSTVKCTAEDPPNFQNFGPPNFQSSGSSQTDGGYAPQLPPWMTRNNNAAAPAPAQQWQPW